MIISTCWMETNGVVLSACRATHSSGHLRPFPSSDNPALLSLRSPVPRPVRRRAHLQQGHASLLPYPPVLAFLQLWHPRLFMTQDILLRLGRIRIPGTSRPAAACVLLCVRACVCVYVCVLCVCAYTLTCMQVFGCMYVSVVCLCLRIYIHVYMHTRFHALKNVRARARVCV